MKIMFFPQIATRSYTDGKWFLLKDGHIRVIKNQIMAIEKFLKDCEYLICIPERMHIADNKDYLYDLPYEVKTKIKSFYFDFSLNVGLNRFTFPMNQLIKNKYLFENVDIIINDVPELARNWKSYFSMYLKKEPILISGIHYIDIYSENSMVGESQYFWRQLVGLLCSDACTIFTQKMKEDYFEYAKHYINYSLARKLEEKTKVFDYMLFSENELNLFRHEEKSDKKFILFISRCSDEKRTQWKFFIQQMKNLKKIRQDFEVFICNPSDVPSETLDAEILDAKDYIKYPSMKLTREQYIKLLWKADIVPLLYNIKNNIAVGYYEAMYCKNIGIEYGKDFKNNSQFLDSVNEKLNELDFKKVVEDIYSRNYRWAKNGSRENNAQRFFNEHIDPWLPKAKS